MANVYKFRELVLVESKTFFEKCVSSLIKFIGYTSTYILNIPNLTLHGLLISSKAWRQHTSSYDEGSAKIYRCLMPDGDVPWIFKGCNTVTDVFLHHIHEFAHLPMFGSRKVLKIIQCDKSTKFEMGPFEWIDSNQVYEMVCSVYSYLKSLGINSNQKVLIFAGTSADWLIVAFACLLLRAPIVTVYPSLRDDYIQSCIQLSEPTLAFVDAKTSIRLISLLPNIPSIRSVILDSQSDLIDLNNLEINGLNIGHLSSIYQTPPDYTVSTSNSQPDDLAFIVFTSGSTGSPKGAMITQANIVGVLAGTQYQNHNWKNKIYPGYLPLSHILELCCELAMIFNGGCIGYCNSGTLFDSSPMLAPNCQSDLKALKPTIMAFVPLILERIRRTINDKISQLPRTKQVMIEAAYNVKAYFYSRGYTTPLLNRIIFNKFAEIFGGRLEFGVCGGAFLSPDLEEFFDIMVVPVQQAYGSTEICCAGTFSEIGYARPYNVGSPFPVSEVKLLPWEEGGYEMNYVNNLKGELVISGPCVCLGYYKNEEMTQEAFIFDPINSKWWFKTADIGELLDDGTFRIIARKTDVVKLSHGEYIEFSPIESAIASSKFVDFVCLTTNSNKSFLVAIISPNLEQLISIAGSVSPDELNLNSLLQRKDIIKIIESDSIKCLVNAQFRKNEIPQKFFFVSEEWSSETDLLTPSMKIKRGKILNKFKHLIESI